MNSFCALLQMRLARAGAQFPGLSSSHVRQRVAFSLLALLNFHILSSIVQERTIRIARVNSHSINPLNDFHTALLLAHLEACGAFRRRRSSGARAPLCFRPIFHVYSTTTLPFLQCESQKSPKGTPNFVKPTCSCCAFRTIPIPYHVIKNPCAILKNQVLQTV